MQASQQRAVAYSVNYSGSDTMVDLMGINIGETSTKIMDTGATIIIVAVSAAIALAAFWVLKRQMKYDIPVEIIEIDKSGTVYKKDKGGIFFDKTGKYRLLWLKKYKVGLSPDKIPFVRTIGQNPIWKFWMQPRKVFLYQYGYKNFSYVTPGISNPGIDFGVGDADVSWGLSAYESGKSLQLKAWYAQMMPYIGMIILAVTLMIITIYVFKSLPQIKDLIAATGKTAEQLGEAAAKMTSSGAIIVGG